MQLNWQQKNAVEQDYRQNLRIIAGPGTGKTTVLTARFLYFLRQKFMPAEKILVLTFTRKATHNFRQRIESQYPSFKRLNIFTYHAFCFELLQREKSHLHQFSEQQPLTVIDESDQKTIYRQLLKTELAKANLSHDHTLISNLIAVIKLFNLNPFSSWTEYQTFLQNQALDFPNDQTFQTVVWNVYQAYQAYKKAKNFLDFNDLLGLAYDLLLNNQTVLARWRNRFQAILIDEFQDTSALQYDLITLLSDYGKQIPVTIVGDPDQTIYTWRNAQIKFILEFDQHFSNVKTVYLKINYRSQQKIIEVANFIISRNKNRLPNQLEAFHQLPNQPALQIAHCSYKNEQAAQIVDKLLVLHQKHRVRLDEMVVLYRANWLAAFLEAELVKRNVAYYVFKGIKFFARQEIKDLFILLHALVSKDDFFVSQLCLWIPYFGNQTLKKLQTQAQYRQLSLWQYLTRFYQSDPLLTRFATPFQNLVAHFANWEQMLASKKSLLTFFEAVLHDYFYPRLAKLIDFELRKSNLIILLEMVENYQRHQTTLSGQEQLTQFLTDTKIYLADGMEATQNRVQLMTIHNTKGLEFDHVFIFDISEDVFPSARSEDLEEERRLFFVALTRARKTLFLTTAFWKNSLFIDELKTLPPSLVENYED